MKQLLERIELLLGEGNVMFYNHGKSAAKTWDDLEIKDVPALMRAVGMGTKKISLESEGDRNALNKALKSGKIIYVATNPWHEKVTGQSQILWFTDRGKLVKTYLELMKEA